MYLSLRGKFRKRKTKERRKDKYRLFDKRNLKQIMKKN